MTKHRGTVVRKPQWWKHLRDWKRVFWKRDRKKLRLRLICVREDEAWCWPDYLGARTDGVCEQCGAAVYFEAQNAEHAKVCSRCAGITAEVV